MPGDQHESLVGRDAERAAVEHFLTRVAGGSGVALCVTGEPGTGKTALLDAAGWSAAERGLLVLRAAGAPFERDLEFATLHQLLFPVVPGWDARSLGDGAAQLRRWSAARPLVLIVDDFQWVDAASAAVLTEVAGFAGLLTAVRIGEKPPAVPRTEVVALRPLAPADADRLLQRHFPVISPRVGHRVRAEAAGNPLALLELAQSLTDEQRSAHRPLPPVLSPAGRLQDLYAERLRNLAPPVRRQLLLAALSRDQESQVVAGDLRSAVPAGLLTGDGRFQHPLARTAVVESSTGAERAAVHRELAARAAAEPERQAWHLAEATVGTDESVAVLLEEAAHRALGRGDGKAAATALLRAADLTAAGPGKSRRLGEAAYVRANVTGDLRAVPALLNAARQADHGGSGSLPVALAAANMLLNIDGDIDAAYQLLIAMIDAALSRSTEEPLLVEALFQLADVCFFSVRADLWAGLEEAVTRLGPAPPDLLTMWVRTMRDPKSMGPSDLMRLDAAIRGIDAEHDPTVVRRIARLAAVFNRTPECWDALLRIVDDGRAGGSIAAAVNAMMMIGLEDLNTGRWAEADEICGEALRLCSENEIGLMSWSFDLIRVIMAARRGHEAEVGEVAARVLAWAVPRGMRMIAQYAIWAQATAAVGRGDFEEAYHHCLAVTAPGVVPAETEAVVWLSLDLIESALRTGRRSEAVMHVRALEDSAIAGVSSRYGLLVLGSAALVAGDDEAPGLFERALALPGASELAWEQARVQLHYGERLRRARAAAQARVQLGAALATFESLDSAPWAARAARELDATTPTRVTQTAARTTVLTPQELQVATLAATGLSNKQIGERLLVSHRTVGAHLHNVFRKLDVSNRGALHDVLDEQPT